MQVNKGEYFSLKQLQAMEFDGYEFDGWYTYTNGYYGGKIDINVPFVADKDFTIRTRYTAI